MGLDEFQTTTQNTSTSEDLEEVKTSTSEWDNENVDIPDFITGNLLGGAEIKVYDDQSASLIISTEYWNYLFYLKQKYADVFYNSTIRLQEDGKYYIRSSEEYDMRPIYSKWYRKGEKQLPRPMNINSEELLHWHIVSGEIEGDEVRLYANWMNDLNSEIMATILRSKIAKARIEREQHPVSDYTRFRFFHNAPPALFEFIGECPINGFQSKWL